MGHRISEWVHRLLVPCAVIATLALRHFGFDVLKIAAIILPIFVVRMLFLIAVDPAPERRDLWKG